MRADRAGADEPAARRQRRRGLRRELLEPPETISRVCNAGATEQLTVRADIVFYSKVDGVRRFRSRSAGRAFGASRAGDGSSPRAALHAAFGALNVVTALIAGAMYTALALRLRSLWQGGPGARRTTASRC